ncbi:DUF302 domain-containing protein [Alphaproteobacteria bacterium HT1-32]|nr:DUF302 domain-containing protein [Alphaproteobacteria bacterium HT1-32]
MLRFISIFIALTLAVPALADGPEQQRVTTVKPFQQLVEDLKASVKTHKMLVVTSACASCGAKGRGIIIPGNMVIGVYRNDFAIRMLEADTDAGIEAPIRFYVTENPDKSATLSWRKPSDIFAPYSNAGLTALALELDGIFSVIAADAVK